MQRASSSSSSKAVPDDRACCCFCLLVHAFARQSVELILNLNSSWLYCLLLLTVACLCLLLLALGCLMHTFGKHHIRMVTKLLALSVPLLLRFGHMLAHFSHFFALVAHFFDILTHLKLSCNFLTFFHDFSSSFGGFGVVWGWILGCFFSDDF